MDKNLPKTGYLNPDPAPQNVDCYTSESPLMEDRIKDAVPHNPDDLRTIEELTTELQKATEFNKCCIPIPLRSEVIAMATAMEIKLRINDHKPGWKNEDDRNLLLRAYEELGELQATVRSKSENDFNDMMETLSPSGGWRGSPDLTASILEECADVCNFMLFVADNKGALRAEVLFTLLNKNKP